MPSNLLDKSISLPKTTFRLYFSFVILATFDPNANFLVPVTKSIVKSKMYATKIISHRDQSDRNTMSVHELPVDRMLDTQSLLTESSTNSICFQVES